MLRLTERDPPAHWPDGTLKHRWQASAVPGVKICQWCGNTRGAVTLGRPCPAGRTALAEADAAAQRTEARDG